MLKKLMTFVKEWVNKPVEKRGFCAVLLGEEMMKVCIILFAGGILLGLSFLILQMCSVEIKTRENIIAIGCFIMLAYCVWLLIPAVKALNAIWKKILFILIIPFIFSIIISLSQWIIFLVIGGLICLGLLKVFFGGSGVSIPTSSNSGNSDLSNNSSDNGRFYAGITGDYIQGNHGDDQRITQRLSDGDVLTEKGERYHIDENGYASKR